MTQSTVVIDDDGFDEFDGMVSLSEASVGAAPPHVQPEASEWVKVIFESTL